MVGGLADWFAVTALFRRPLGLPIPHTALIVERKDQFAATLGQFVQENFLNADVLADRIRSAGLVPRLAGWLADEANAGALRRPGRGSGRHGGRGPARRGRPARADRRADPGGRLRRGGPAGRAGAAADHRGRAPHRAVQRPRCPRPTATSPTTTSELREMFESEAPRWIPDRSTGGSSTGSTTGCATGSRRWRPTPTTRPGASSRPGWLACPSGWRPTRSCASAGERLKREVLGSTALRDWSSSLWQKPRKPCGPRRPTRSPSCAAGWPAC